MAEQKYEFGMVGLGVMGRNLALNILEHGFSVSGYDQEGSKTGELQAEGGQGAVYAAPSLEALVGALSKPRSIILLVPAGAAVDSALQGLAQHVEPGDLLIDAGNSYFKDTDARARSLAEKGILYMGMGISGGEAGARRGPSLMPGGPREGYERIRTMLEAVAASVNGEPCVGYLGPGSAGHYVKMVHNGIEYGLMQLIAESYDLMKRGLGLTNPELAEVYGRWNEGELNAFLIEITARIFQKMDAHSGKHLIDLILDEARQKGTGMWTSQDAMDIQSPAPTIDAAVTARNLSIDKAERTAASKALQEPDHRMKGERAEILKQLKGALYAGMLITYAQGMALLRKASGVYRYGLRLEEVARIWRGGCIIRAAALEPIRAAFQAQPDLPNLLVDGRLGQEVLARQNDLRAITCLAGQHALPVPGLMASLAYLDGYRSAWLPASLIQAQRDDFGAHTYERIDQKGVFHTQWEQSNSKKA